MRVESGTAELSQLDSPPQQNRRPADLTEQRSGFTLPEILVVLIVLALAAAFAVPALLPKRDRSPTGLASLLQPAREAAASRGETIHLRIMASGDWRMTGAASSDDGPVASGHVDPFPGLPLTLIVSPLGSCGFDAFSTVAAAAIRLDPMACEVLD